MVAISWDAGSARTGFDHFMYWTSVDGAAAELHSGVVTRVLGTNRRDGFTHDARLDRSAGGVQGVTLDADSF
eukprot:6198525-Pleurochrysis_carterae.AAC.1